MNISIDCRAANIYRGTGIGNYTYQLLNNINLIDTENKYNIYISENSSLDLNLKENFSLLYSNKFKENNFWENIKEPLNLLNDTNLYHTPQNGIGILENVDFPQCITLHDIIPLKMPETVSNTYLKIFNKEISKILANTNGIITVSNYSKNDIHQTLNYPLEKIFVTHLAAEKQYKVLNENLCTKILKEYYNLDPNYILYVGGFSPRKNILGLINSFELAKHSLPKNTKLIIIGQKGISYNTYQNRVNELGLENDVIFPGFIKNEHMPIFYNLAKVVVYPSFYEGFGLPPLEAMACGTPVIASNLTSIPEVLEDAALLINPYDEIALASSIKEIFSNPLLENNLIEKSLLHSNKFDWKNTAKTTLDAFYHIM
ncbi:MAG: glycosyltransferase family 4 protein [Sarcina sp.]